MTDRSGKDEQVQTGLRVPRSLIDRLDRLAEERSQPGMKITRSEVLRLALYAGLEAMEKEGNGGEQ